MILVGFAIDRSQPLQKYGAVILVGNGVFVFGVLGLLQQLGQDLDCVVVFPLSFVDDRDVVLHFQRIGNDGRGFLQRIHGLIELAVAAIDFGNAHIGLRIGGISLNDDFVLFQRGIGLAVVHQILRQAAHRIQIVVIQFGGLAISVNRLLVVLLLLVGVAQRGVQLGGARLSGIAVSTCKARAESPSSLYR